MRETIAAGRTPFQNYEFLQLENGGATPVLDGDIQSVESDEAIYHEALVHLPMLHHPAPKSVLIMGGGEGAALREALKHDTVERVVMVDLDETFVRLCRTHLPHWSGGAFDDPRTTLIHDDVNAYLRSANQIFDVVIGDLIDVLQDETMGLYSPAFFDAVAARTAPDGILGTQIGPVSTALTRAGRSGAALMAERLGATFTHHRHAMAPVPCFYEPWGFFVAARRQLEPSTARRIDLFQRNAEARGVALPATGAEYLACCCVAPGWTRTSPTENCR